MSDHILKPTHGNVFFNVKGYETTIRNFSNYLKVRGYREGTRNNYRSALSHFLRWLSAKSSQGQAINNEMVVVFLNQHLPACRCLPPVYREYKTIRAALNNLLISRDKPPLMPVAAKIPPAIKNILCEFDGFQRDVVTPS